MRVCLSWSIFLPLEPPCPLPARVHQLAEVSTLVMSTLPSLSARSITCSPDTPWRSQNHAQGKPAHGESSREGCRI
jgi:hypothetical protein